MTNLEDQIIAYLDGTLDESSRAELLHMLSVSPEKRKLLEEHIKLREIISLGHKPQPVPLTTERKLADRIPVLMQELPYLAEKSARFIPVSAIRGTSYLNAFSRYVSGIFTSRFAPAVGLGTLLLMGGLTWYLASPSHETDVATLVKPHASKQSVPSSEGTSNTNGTSNTHGTTDAVAQSGSGSIMSQNQGQRPTTSTHIVRDARRTSTPIDEPQNSNNGIPHNDGEPVQYSDNSNATNNSPQQPEKLTTPPEDVPPSNAPPANAQENTVLESVARENIAQSNSPSSDIKNPEIDPTPLPLPSEKENATGRWFAQAGMASDMNFRPNQQEQVYQAGAGKTFPVIGFGYEITPHIAIGIEGGSSELSQQSEEKVVEPGVNNSGPVEFSRVGRLEYNSTIIDVDAIWSQATVRFTVNPEDQFRIEATGGAGAAYVDGLAPMVSLGIGGTYSLVGDVDLTMGATLRGAWMNDLNVVASTDQQFEGPVAVVSNRATSATVFTSAVSGRIGLRVGF